MAHVRVAFSFGGPRLGRRWAALGVAVLLVLPLLGACDDAPSAGDHPAEVPAAASASLPPPPVPEAPHTPEIIVDRSNVAVGKESVATGEPSLEGKVTALVRGAPAIEGQTVDVVAMRNARPSQVEAVVGALRSAKAAGVNVKTQARDDSTQSMRVSFAPTLADCAVAIWIGKDASIAIWPARGGKTRRLGHGLAGPDMTLGTDAIRTQWAGCNASEFAIGADDTMNWGLVFDLGTSALQAPGARASAAVLLPTAAPGRKVVVP